MAAKSKGPSPHDASTSPSYPMGPFSTGGSSYTNTVPTEEEEEEANHTHQDPRRPRGINSSHENTFQTLPLQEEAPPMYAPPNRQPPGHTALPAGYDSQQHLMGADAPAHPPPMYTKYATAAQARWAKSSRIARFLCVGIILVVVAIIVAVAAGIEVTRNNNGGGPGPGNGPGNGPPGIGPGGPGSGSNTTCFSDAGSSCNVDSDCMSLFCRPFVLTCSCTS